MRQEQWRGERQHKVEERRMRKEMAAEEAIRVLAEDRRKRCNVVNAKAEKIKRMQEFYNSNRDWSRAKEGTLLWDTRVPFWGIIFPRISERRKLSCLAGTVQTSKRQRVAAGPIFLSCRWMPWAIQLLFPLELASFAGLGENQHRARQVFMHKGQKKHPNVPREEKLDAQQQMYFLSVCSGASWEALNPDLDEASRELFSSCITPKPNSLQSALPLALNTV